MWQSVSNTIPNPINVNKCVAEITKGFFPPSQNLTTASQFIILVVKKKVISILNSTKTAKQYDWVATYTAKLHGNTNIHKIEERTTKQKYFNSWAEWILMPYTVFQKISKD